MSEPRYRDDEIREIFERASAHPETHALTHRDGLTLAELQDIGREAGLDPERIARAAAALDVRRGAEPRLTSLGLPVAVGRTTPLPRAPTDEEWDRLVAELRQTFHARGTDSSGGSLRHWSNGNLHAAIEPTDDGWRLRLGTLRGGATPMNLAGGAALVFAMVIFMVLILTSGATQELLGPLIIGMGGAGTLGYNAIRLPAWANRREEQFEHIAARARAMLDRDPTATTSIADGANADTS